MTDDHQTSQLSEADGAGDRQQASEKTATSNRSWGQIWEGLVRIGLGEAALRVGAGLASLALILLVVWVMGNFYLKGRAGPSGEAAKAAVLPSATPVVELALVDLPQLAAYQGGISRQAQLHTILPDRPRFEIDTYEVKSGDTLFTIAEKYGLKPQTLLWGNYNTLKDNPHNLRVSQKLNILPVNGVLYEWHSGDGLNGVAKFFGVKPEDIVNFPGNKLDVNTVGDFAKPNINAGTLLVIPGGKRDFITWSAPRVTRKEAAAAKVIGPGNCGNILDGPVGNGTFVWPTKTKFISNPFSLEINHPAIDLPGFVGSPISAVDAGVVVYAGWNDWGYGYMIMIDHGNGWQSLYAHLSQITAGCGTGVTQGQSIGLMGSTGNSTGPHLHLELRNDAYGKVNPVQFLR